jgi:hypothetical protein
VKTEEGSTRGGRARISSFAGRHLESNAWEMEKMAERRNPEKPIASASPGAGDCLELSSSYVGFVRKDEHDYLPAVNEIAEISRKACRGQGHARISLP